MGAVLNRSTAIDGVIAYQDSEEVELFHYLPAEIRAVFNETLLNFKVEYYGINQKPFYIDLGNGLYESVVGGVTSGKANPDITQSQRDALIQDINEKFKVENPRLVPLEIYDVEVQPVFAKQIADKGVGSSATFPKNVKFGSTFNYAIDSGNSLFASLVGSQVVGSQQVENSAVGINIFGMADFYGDPWKARISCNLSQVWDYVRTQVNLGINLGYFSLGTDITKISQSMIRDSIIKVEYIEGSGGDEFGRQLLESTKTIFEAINQQATSGEGFFRFDPNPDPQPPKEVDDPWGASLLPWSASLNVGYGSEVFSQEINFEQEVSFTGKLPVAIVTSMNLALECSGANQQYFYDLQTKETGCITKQKEDGLQARAKKESSAKNDELVSLYNDVKAKIITVAEYTELKKLLNDISFTEGDDTSIKGKERWHRIREAFSRKKVEAAV